MLRYTGTDSKYSERAGIGSCLLLRRTQDGLTAFLQEGEWICCAESHLLFLKPRRMQRKLSQTTFSSTKTLNHL